MAQQPRLRSTHWSMMFSLAIDMSIKDTAFASVEHTPMISVGVPDNPSENILMFRIIFGFLTAMNFHACLFPPEGASLPASRTFLRTSSGTSFGLKFLTLL